MGVKDSAASLPDSEGRLAVELDCGICIVRVPAGKVKAGNFDSSCKKRHNLRKERK